MTQFHADEHPLADPSPTPVAFSDGLPPDAADDCYEPQIPTRADEAQTVHHALWASTILDSEVTPPYVPGPKEILHSLVLEPVGCLPDRPEVQTQNRASFHFPGNPEIPFESRSGRSSLSPVYFLSSDGFVQSLNLLQQPVSTITCTLVVPLHLPTQP